MLSPAGRRASGMLALPFAAGIYMFSECGAFAQSADDLPMAAEPLLGEEGDWSADFNEAQIACYQGSMSACDSIWLDDRVLLDSLLGQYGRTCGGRADHREISLAGLTCREAFPGHE
jgi:hypothetical protein